MPSPPHSTSSARARILVIGPPALMEQARRALPGCEIVASRETLEGVWQAGNSPIDGALVAMSVGDRALIAVSSLRRMAPSARILATSLPLDEPLARQAVAAGADDYLLEPLDVEALRDFFKPGGNGAAAHGPAPAAPPAELALLSDALRHLDEGVGPALERIAGLIRAAFDGASVTLEWEGAVIGDPAGGPLSEGLRRGGQTVGRVTVGLRGAAAPEAGARLLEYARLIEVILALAGERQHWRDLAWTDDLSGLRNRRYFERALDDLIRRATDQRLRITVLLFDIDEFKSYNDRFGHATGDRLLREVALLLMRCTRETDIVCRYGGDEFAVVFWDAEKPRTPGSDHPREPILLCRRFHETIRKHSFSCLGEHGPGPVTVSGGLACFPWNGMTREQLLHAADEALRAAKRTGKNRIHLAGEGSEVTGE